MTPEKTTVVVIEKTIGGTVYIIENVISENTRETAYEKVKRLILNNKESDQHKPEMA